MVARIRRALPTAWFADAAPVLTGILTGAANALSWVYGMIQTAILQTRIATSTGAFVDMAAQDFYGTAVQRGAGESDAALSSRIRNGLFQARATRPSIVAQLTALTGRAPGIIDPWRPGDVGAYGYGTLGYSTSGVWGSLHMPAQTFVFAYRPDDGVHPSGTDAAIYGSVAACLPAGGQAWVQINS